MFDDKCLNGEFAEAGALRGEHHVSLGPGSGQRTACALAYGPGHDFVPSAPTWLADAVLYQIYPQSFADSNGDGIGDLSGVATHLDHLAWLGVDTVWFNPCFASPIATRATTWPTT